MHHAEKPTAKILPFPETVEKPVEKPTANSLPFTSLPFGSVLGSRSFVALASRIRDNSGVLGPAVPASESDDIPDLAAIAHADGVSALTSEALTRKIRDIPNLVALASKLCDIPGLATAAYVDDVSLSTLGLIIQACSTRWAIDRFPHADRAERVQLVGELDRIVHQATPATSRP